jgi:tRNA (guanine26-N2/guanine27-N2)-dimethyltransferase
LSEGAYSYSEGATKLLGPSPSRIPAMLPAFFNPRGKFARDVSLVCYSAFAASSEEKGKLSFADALCGIGARGLRVAKEIPDFTCVYLNDVNSRALDYARASAELNAIQEKCVFSKLETCSFLDSRNDRFNAVDVDPFGTPSPFVDSAIRAVSDGGILSLTATDSAVLCGVYPKVAERKYMGTSIRTDYSHEVGMRLIYGLAAHSAMRLEAGIEPLFCHHDMHYFRVYCRIKVGNSYSRSNQDQMGFVLHCFRCGYRSVLSRRDFFASERKMSGNKSVPKSGLTPNAGNLDCPICKANKKLAIAGPLWIGNIQSREFVSHCAKISQISLFQVDELDIPLYYDLTAISEKASTRTPKIADVKSQLESKGYATSRTRLNPNALRTEAPADILRSVVSDLAR